MTHDLCGQRQIDFLIRQSVRGLLVWQGLLEQPRDKREILFASVRTLAGFCAFRNQLRGFADAAEFLDDEFGKFFEVETCFGDFWLGDFSWHSSLNENGPGDEPDHSSLY